jgi:gluconolactonase
MNKSPLAPNLVIVMGWLAAMAADAQAPGAAPPTQASLATATAPPPETDRLVAPPAVAAPPIAPVPPPATLGDGPPLPARPFSITKADPGLDQIIAPNAKLELLGDRFGLTEGPVWVPDGQSGYILFVDMLSNVIYKMTPDKKVSVFLYRAGYSGKDLLHAGIQTRRGRANVLLIGPECTSRDAQGRILWCASNDGAIMRLEKDGTRTILANNYEGKRFDGPNDMAIKSDGAIYFTDTDTGLRDGRLSPLKQLPYAGVYRVKDDKVTLLVDDKALGGSPNGIAFSPDEKYLYLTSGFKKLMRYEVKDDGTLGAATLFAEGDGIGDGLKVDKRGDVFSTGGAGAGEIRITAPDGKYLGLLNIPLDDAEPKREICALNDAFGDPDGKTLYIMAGEAVFKIRLKVAGILPGPAH